MVGNLVRRIKTLYKFSSPAQFFDRVADTAAFEKYKADILKDYDDTHFIIADPISKKIELYCKLKAK